MIQLSRRVSFFSLAIFGLAASILLNVKVSRADELEVGQDAPLFHLIDNQGNDFSLAARKDQGWTVLYFYPKAETPGCTKQACSFRDAIDVIHLLNAEVYGISADGVEDIAAFHKNHQLKFPLLADPNGEVINKYGAMMPKVGMAKRWTFIIDPKLKIRAIERDVDPAVDAKRVADTIRGLQEAK